MTSYFLVQVHGAENTRLCCEQQDLCASIGRVVESVYSTWGEGALPQVEVSALCKSQPEAPGFIVVKSEILKELVRAAFCLSLQNPSQWEKICKEGELALAGLRT